jgi:hypothetical protein
MADKFDPYREALVVETETIWPEGSDVPPAEQTRLATLLHADPAGAEQLEYVRTHTGFCRRIVVTDADIERVSASA